MRIRSRGLAAFVAVLALLAVGSALNAQQLTGNIFGYAADEQGGRLPGVTVTLTGGGAPQVFTTDSRGEYRFLNIPPGGNYTLTFDLQGFTKVTKSGVQVSIGTRHADFGHAEALERRGHGHGARRIGAARDPQGRDRRDRQPGGVEVDPLGSRPLGRPAVGPGHPGRPRERRRQRKRTAVRLRRQGRADQSGRVERGRRDDHGHGRARLLAGLLRLRLLRGDPGRHRRNGSLGGHAGRAAESGDQARHQRLPRQRAHAARERTGGRPTTRPTSCWHQGVGGAGAATTSTKCRTTASRSADRCGRTTPGCGPPMGATRSTSITAGDVSDKTTLEGVNGKLNVQFLESTAGTLFYSRDDKLKFGRSAGTAPPRSDLLEPGRPHDDLEGRAVPGLLLSTVRHGVLLVRRRRVRADPAGRRQRGRLPRRERQLAEQLFLLPDQPPSASGGGQQLVLLQHGLARA